VATSGVSNIDLAVRNAGDGVALVEGNVWFAGVNGLETIL
jgi:hypothetical protein